MALDRFKENALGVRNAAADKAMSFGKKAAVAVKDGAELAAVKAQEVGHDIQLAVYKPVMKEEFFGFDFDIPKMIVIVDEDERKGVDVCEGAIGWLSRRAGMEVLHLYDEAVGESGLRFHPVATFDEVYRQDPFDKDLYISLSDYFDVMRQDQITEIKDIAFRLGAKHVRVELCEESKKVVIGKGRGRAEAKLPDELPEDSLDASLSVEAAVESRGYAKKEVLIDQTFEGDSQPQRPELRWFKNNREILSLINMRCEEAVNRAQSYNILARCSSTSSVSLKLAKKIDLALFQMGARSNFTFRSEVTNEARKVMKLLITF